MGNVAEVNDANFNSEVIESKIPVIVDFWASWCGPCKMIAPIFESLAGKIGDKVKFVKLNTDDNQTTAAQYQVMSIPTLIIYKDGKEAERLVGLLPEQQLEEKINGVIG